MTHATEGNERALRAVSHNANAFLRSADIGRIDFDRDVDFDRDDASAFDLEGFYQNTPWTFTDQSGLPLALFDRVPALPNLTASRRWRLLVKSFFDFAISIAALVFLMPLFIFVGLAIKLTSPGPVLFTQMREGLGGVGFRAFKFRTMRTDMCDSTGIAYTTEGDPRVTPIGRFLRATSIDELPQLINVLRGEMSLVGPRPHVPNMLAGERKYTEVVPYYYMRTYMLPGITGWAQVNGHRGLVDTAQTARQRVDHDIAYIQNFSLLLDLKIILKTALREFITGSAN